MCTSLLVLYFSHRLDWAEQLENEGLKLVDLLNNPIDEVWPDSERPERSKDQLEIHDLRYAGQFT